MSDIRDEVRSYLAELAEENDDQEQDSTAPGFLQGIMVKSDPALLAAIEELKESVVALAGKEDPDQLDLKPLAEAIAQSVAQQNTALMTGLKSLITAVSNIKNESPQVSVALDLDPLVKATEANTRAVTDLVKAFNAPKELVFDKNGAPTGIKRKALSVN